MVSRPSGQDLLTGKELRHYRIAEKIGSGGMGEVYRARDEHLARDVAIKVLPPGTLADEPARKHFRKEALILSQLNHPNIATIYDFDTQQNLDFLVMEYIPGITLSEKIAGPLAEKDVLRLGVQLAEGLAAIHERGVTHRDLKPSNVRIAGDGRLKILDFGLAELRRPVSGSATTESLSENQSIAGTLPYMAPEQLQGDRADARTDIHAAGLVLYEMATGQRPFGKLEHAQLIAAILGQTPALPRHLKPELSPELERIIGKCLEKDPENRYQSAKELAIDLRRLLTPRVKMAEVPAVAGPQPTAQQQQPAASRARSRLWKWPIPGLVAVGLAAAVWLLRPALPPPEVTGTTQLTQDGVRKAVGNNPIFSDGSRVYFQEVTPDNGWPLMQVSTEGGEPVPLAVPFKGYSFGDISPNGHELLLLEGSANFHVPSYPLWRLSLPGLQPQRIGNLAPTGWAATWSPDGSVIYYASNPDIFAADADGSHPRKLLTTEGNPWWIRVSPDGRLLRFSVSNPKNSTMRLWEAHSDGSGLRELLPRFSNRDGVCCGNWTADGRYFVFELVRGGTVTLWAMRDAGDLWRKVSHEPVQLTHGELGARYPLPSRDGKKIFFNGAKRRGEVMRYDLGTHAMTPFLPGFSAQYLSFTKDGQRMAYASYPQGILWQSRTDGSDRHQLTFPPMLAGLPRWSPDGSRIAFTGDPPGKPSQIFVIPAGGGDPEQVTSGDEGNEDATWSPDGNSLAYASGPWDPSSTFPLHIVNLKTRQVTDVPNSPGLWSPRWSPDGRYLLATPMDASGIMHIMLYDFNLHSWQQLTQGKVEADYPAWTPDGKCVYFNSYGEKGSPEYRICLSDRKVQHVADMGQAGNLAARWWTGLAPDGSFLALRDTSSEEIYALDVKFP